MSTTSARRVPTTPVVRRVSFVRIGGGHGLGGARRAGGLGAVRWLGVALVAVLGAMRIAPNAAAADAPPAAPAAPAPVDPPDGYAGRDAAWWVGQLRGVGTHAAAREVLKLIGAPAAPALLDAFGDRDPVVRHAVRSLLQELRGDLRPAVPALARALEAATADEDVGFLLSLAERLGSDGAALVPAMLRHAGGGTPTARRTLERARELGGPAGVLVPRLRELLRGGDPDAQLSALRSLAAYGADAAPAVPEIVAVLVPLADAKPPSKGSSRGGDLLRQAVTTLGAIGDVGPEGQSALEDLVKRDSGGRFGFAASALARIAAVRPEALGRLVALMSSDKDSVRRQVAEALQTLPGTLPASMLTPLVALLTPSPAAASFATELLRRVDAPPEIVMKAVLAALPSMSAPANADGILHELARRDPEALVATLATAPEGAERLLFAQLGHVSVQLANSAGRGPALAWMIARLRARPAGSKVEFAEIQAFRTLLGDRPDGPELLSGFVTGHDGPMRAVAVQLLGEMKSASGLIAAWMASPDANLRKQAFDLLAASRRGLSPAEDQALLKALDDPTASLRASAAAALIASRLDGPFPYARPDGDRLRLASALVELVRRPDDPPARSAALTTLISLRTAVPAAVDPLVDVLLASDDAAAPVELMCNALAVVAKDDPRALRTRLLAALEPGRTEVTRATACLALVALDEQREAVLAALPALLREGPPTARWRALVAARNLGLAAASLEASVRPLVASADFAVAGAACRALAAIAPASDEARRALAALALDRTRPGRASAISLLPAFGAKAVDDLLRCRDDLEMRPFLWDALRTLGPSAHDALPILEEVLRTSPRDAALRALVTSLRAPSPGPAVGPESAR